jgi:hypothetical protein
LPTLTRPTRATEGRLWSTMLAGVAIIRG